MNRLKQTSCILATILAIIVGLAVSDGFAYTITFDDLSDLDSVGNQYAALGITFSGATVLTAGVSLNEFEFPPFSGSSVVFDDGGPIILTFSSPVVSVGGYFTYLSPLIVSAYDGSSSLLGSVGSAHSANLALSGDVGSTPNEFLQLTFASGISSVVITGDPLGGSFVLDDLTVSPVSIPEPSSLLLMAVGVATLVTSRVIRTTT